MNFQEELIKEWLETFDGNSEITLLSEIVNNNVCIPAMVNSICAHHLGETESAKDFYKRMWRK